MDDWAESFDVVVCGFGGAGACAALEASAAGARVLVLERFEGGGATRRSGGVIYAGGGTAVQQQAGVVDTPAAMHAYLAEETRGAVSDEALWRFCEESPEQMRWLESLGLSFSPRVFEGKTTQPPEGYGLYFSGNEKQYSEPGELAPRGHVPAGRGMTGRVLFEALERAVLQSDVVVRRFAQPTRLLQEGGSVVGLEVLTLPENRAVREAHAALAGLGMVSESARSRLRAFEASVGRTTRIRAVKGVVLATGGFVFNPEMMRRYAPAYAGTMPLGTVGDDGSGIALGQSVGGSVSHMDRCAASRFFAPPEAFTAGVLVDVAGRRVCDESLYGATISAHIAEHGGRAFLIVDQRLVDRAACEMQAEERFLDRPLGEILGGEVNHLIFRQWCAWANMHVNRVRAPTLEALERRCGMPDGALVATLRGYDECAARGGPDAMGKSARLLERLDHPPFYAVRCDLDSKLFPGPCITLGGLRVDERTGTVLREDGSAVAGLFAAGRTAVGIASRSYVSGLSLADCIHSGRRAGLASARRLPS